MALEAVETIGGGTREPEFLREKEMLQLEANPLPQQAEAWDVPLTTSDQSNHLQPSESDSASDSDTASSLDERFARPTTFKCENCAETMGEPGALSASCNETPCPLGAQVVPPAAAASPSPGGDLDLGARDKLPEVAVASLNGKCSAAQVSTLQLNVAIEEAESKEEVPAGEAAATGEINIGCGVFEAVAKAAKDAVYQASVDDQGLVSESSVQQLEEMSEPDAQLLSSTGPHLNDASETEPVTLASSTDGCSLDEEEASERETALLKASLLESRGSGAAAVQQQQQPLEPLRSPAMPWVLCVDPTTGSQYFLHSMTGESLLDFPANASAASSGQRISAIGDQGAATFSAEDFGTLGSGSCPVGAADARNARGESALHLACSIGWDDGLAILLERGFDANAKDSDGRTPLHVVCEAQGAGGDAALEACIKRLTHYGAAANAQNSHGATPLHLATAAGKEGLVTVLLAAGASSSVPDLWGETPLHLAARQGRLGIVKLLAGPVHAAAPVEAAEAAVYESFEPQAGSWQRGITETGQVYYFDGMTGESRWELPTEGAIAVGEVNSAESSPGMGVSAMAAATAGNAAAHTKQQGWQQQNQQGWQAAGLDDAYYGEPASAAGTGKELELAQAGAPWGMFEGQLQHHQVQVPSQSTATYEAKYSESAGMAGNSRRLASNAHLRVWGRFFENAAAVASGNESPAGAGGGAASPSRTARASASRRYAANGFVVPGGALLSESDERAETFARTSALSASAAAASSSASGKMVDLNQLAHRVGRKPSWAEPLEPAQYDAVMAVGRRPAAAEDARNAALFVAVIAGRVDDARALLAAGASADALDDARRTPLHHACRRGDGRMVQLLVSKGNAAIEAKSCTGEAPLVVAAEFGAERCVRLLLYAGAEPNASDANGDTALHAAARNGRVNCVRLLLAYGARRDVTNRFLETPMQATEEAATAAATSLAGSIPHVSAACAAEAAATHASLHQTLLLLQEPELRSGDPSISPQRGPSRRQEVPIVALTSPVRAGRLVTVPPHRVAHALPPAGGGGGGGGGAGSGIGSGGTTASGTEELSEEDGSAGSEATSGFQTPPGSPSDERRGSVGSGGAAVARGGRRRDDLETAAAAAAAGASPATSLRPAPSRRGAASVSFGGTSVMASASAHASQEQSQRPQPQRTVRYSHNGWGAPLRVDEAAVEVEDEEDISESLVAAAGYAVLDSMDWVWGSIFGKGRSKAGGSSGGGGGGGFGEEDHRSGSETVAMDRERHYYGTNRPETRQGEEFEGDAEQPGSPSMALDSLPFRPLEPPPDVVRAMMRQEQHELRRREHTGATAAAAAGAPPKPRHNRSNSSSDSSAVSDSAFPGPPPLKGSRGANKSVGASDRALPPPPASPAGARSPTFFSMSAASGGRSYSMRSRYRDILQEQEEE